MKTGFRPGEKTGLMFGLPSWFVAVEVVGVEAGAVLLVLALGGRF